MPKLTDHQGTSTVKGLILGDAGSGKTSGLESLVKAGYFIRVYDFDNLLGSLYQRLKKGNIPPDKVSFQTFTDEYEGSSSPLMLNGKQWTVKSPIKGVPKAFADALVQLNHWKAEGEDLGVPANWGKDTIVVVDTLTTMSRAAYQYAVAMNPMGDPRQNFFTAQQLIMNTLSLLCSKSFKPHVLVLAHVDYEKNQLDLTKGFPRSIGSALNTQISAVFNLVLLCESQGSTKVIRSNSTGVVDLKNPVVFKVSDPLPLETGYAEVFKAILN